VRLRACWLAGSPASPNPTLATPRKKRKKEKTQAQARTRATCAPSPPHRHGLPYRGTHIHTRMQMHTLMASVDRATTIHPTRNAVVRRSPAMEVFSSFTSHTYTRDTGCLPQPLRTAHANPKLAPMVTTMQSAYCTMNTGCVNTCRVVCSWTSRTRGREGCGQRAEGWGEWGTVSGWRRTH
jgi:hypothetical protein